MSAVKLRPPPSVADTPTFDRWIRESLLGFLAAGNTEGLQAADADLDAIASLSGTGIAVRSAANTWALRTLVEGSGVTIANANGVAGNPVISASGGGGSGVGELLVDGDMNLLFGDDGDLLYEG